MANEPLLGGIFMFGGNFAPRGYALCQGQLLAISTNTALFSILGTSFGGNGVTNFGLPDLRGRMALGTGQGPGLSPIDLGQQAGVASVTLLTSNLPAHTHGITLTVNAAADGRPASDSPAGAVPDSGGPVQYAAAPDNKTTMNAGLVTGVIAPTGGNQPVNTQNPYLGINYIIATQGIYPSRN